MQAPAFGSSPVGTSTFLYRDLEPVQAAKRISDLGFRVIDVVSILGKGHINAADPMASADTWKRLTENYMLHIATLNVTQGGSGQWEPEKREAERVLVEGCIALAKELGVDKITVQAGQRVEDERRNEMLEIAAKGLRDLCDRCGEHGINLSFEIHKNLLIETEAQARELIDMVDRKNLGVTFDTSQTGAVGEPVADTLRSLGPLVQHVHLRDYRGDQFMVAPPHGECNFQAVGQALKDIGYAGALIFEVGGRDLDLKARDLLLLDAWKAVNEAFSRV